MFLFPLLLSFVVSVVDFVGAIYVIGHYTKRYEKSEISAAAVVGVATFLLCVTIFYGEQVFRGKTGDEIVGCVMTGIVVIAALIVYRKLRAGNPRGVHTAQD